MPLPPCPSECRHRRTRFIGSHRASGVDRAPEAHFISVCADCGRFFVHGHTGGVHFRVEFELATDEALAAAGQYLRRLDAQELIRKKSAFGIDSASNAD